MKATLVRIGNSRGIRIPKPILEQCGITEEVELEVEDGRLIIRPAKAPRSGWADAFASMTRAGDDSLIDEEPASSWDKTEWRW